MALHSDTQALEVLRASVKDMPELLMILGTGWNQVVQEVEVEVEIGYKEWLGAEASVPGHEGKLVIGTLSGKRVAIMVGRLHMYEGYSGREATMPIRVASQAGVKTLITTAACGALNEMYRVGDFVILSDLLTLFLALDNPLVGPQFLDLSQVFEPRLRDVARRVMIETGASYREGVYAYYHGPTFETPVDKMALHHLGADVVGMSTVPEVIMARWEKMQVLSLAFVTNLAFVKHNHEEVLAESKKAAGKMVEVLKGVVGKL